MKIHTANVSWDRGEQPFLDNRYSRAHLWRFDGGAVVRASSSPHVVAAPFSDPSAVDPEEAFIAALSSCHMLWFLSLAAARGFRVDRYDDPAEGVLEEDAERKLAMTRVTLRPRVAFSGFPLPTRTELEALHHDAHERCFLSRSVKCEMHCLPEYGPE